MEIAKLRQQIIKANEAYRTGNAIISDSEYDALVAKLSQLSDGQDPLLYEIGFKVPHSDQRKEKLPIAMYSMNKVKSLAEIHSWAKLKGIPSDSPLIITPKYDGLSFCVDQKNQRAWTRGNGLEGQRSDAHYAMIMSQKKLATKLPFDADFFCFGEIVMNRSVFAKKWRQKFKNSRNMAAGALNRKEPDAMLTDFDFLRYGLVLTKETQSDSFELEPSLRLRQQRMQFLNNHLNGLNSVDFHLTSIDQLSEELLQSLFVDFSKHYEVDGLILELDDIELQNALGREKNGNPVYARAWKGFVEQQQASRLMAINYQISKQGYLKPVGQIEPVELDGVTVTNVTLNNARTILENKLGIGALVTIIRSGQVIPKIIAVLEGKQPQLPKHCPSCQTLLKFNDSEVELICPNHLHCPEQRLQRIVSFFAILGAQEVAGGVIKQFFEAGYDSIAKILALTQDQMQQLDYFAKRKAQIVYQSIRQCLTNVSLARLRHASGLFEGLGTKKLELVDHFDDPQQAPSFDQLMAIHGFSETSAQAFLDGYQPFWQFVQELPIAIEFTKQAESIQGPLKDKFFCFTGFRNQPLAQRIGQLGGIVSDSFSKNINYLICKNKNSNSSKLTKAKNWGIPILQQEELEEYLSQWSSL